MTTPPRKALRLVLAAFAHQRLNSQEAAAETEIRLQKSELGFLGKLLCAV